MADAEQVAMLLRSVEEWNAWRDKHPGIQPDLMEAELAGADLRNANLVRADLSDADLSQAEMSGAVLRRGATVPNQPISRGTL